MNKKLLILVLAVALLVSVMPGGMAQAFAQRDDAGSHGFLFGLWHGLLAPWSLIARIFIPDVAMYFSPNTGFGYDIGFLIGVGGSLPVGWIAALISTGMHIFA